MHGCHRNGPPAAIFITVCHTTGATIHYMHGCHSNGPPAAIFITACHPSGATVHTCTGVTAMDHLLLCLTLSVTLMEQPFTHARVSPQWTTCCYVSHCLHLNGATVHTCTGVTAMDQLVILLITYCHQYIHAWFLPQMEP
jgi:hypothetical protein